MELVQTKESLNYRELVIKCAQVLDEKKAEDIILMDVKKVTPKIGRASCRERV